MAKPAKATHFQKPHTRVSVLHRSSNFHTKITGYRSGKEPWLNQVHHVLPCCLFKAAYILSAINNDALKAKYINDCLWVTKWDINLGNNLKQLPLWGAYVTAYKHKQIPPLTGPVNLPCHNRDHNNKKGYNKEVRDWLRDNIWDSLNVQKEPHPDDLKTILDELKNGEVRWASKLSDRATTRQGGTWVAWRNRRSNKKWYEPFSMAKTPTPRNVP